MFKDGIPESALPRTFRDAFMIVRKLGLSYIWIDSLCITQDSVEDWEREALQMANVYGNSSCNITATGRNSHEGCFKLRNPLRFVPCPAYKSNGFHIFAQKNDSPARRDAPLLTRAWVFQEHILAPRNVYFGNSILYWHCRERLSWEKKSTQRRAVQSSVIGFWEGAIRENA
jgi:hypothetical protein